MKHFFRGAAFAFMLVASSAICLQLTQAKGESVQSKIKDGSTIQTVQIELKQPITVDELFSEEDSSFFENVILESDFSFDNEAIHDFYTVNSGNQGKNIKEEYIENRKAFLKDTKKNMHDEDFNAESVENLLVTKFTVNGKKENIDQLKKGLKIGKVNVEGDRFVFMSTSSAKTSPFIAGGTSTTVMAATTSLAYLAPNSGSSFVYPSSSGGRYVQQFMKWNAIYFSWDQTYEHDFFLYNYDRQTYLNGASSQYPGCYPVTLYSATTWPAAAKPYIDTRFDKNFVSCEIDELAYTIGVAQASALQANVSYYTYMRTSSGNASSDRFKLQGQIGHRMPTSCYSTWCSWGDDQPVNLIPSWSYNVPGSQAWTR